MPSFRFGATDLRLPSDVRAPHWQTAWARALLRVTSAKIARPNERISVDHELLKDITHFKVLLKKHDATSVDMGKMFTDKAYAREVLNAAAKTDNEELVRLSAQLTMRLGLAGPTAPTVSPVTEAIETAAPTPEEPPKTKYVFGARG